MCFLDDQVLTNSFVFRGLNHLVDHMFVHSARYIKHVNSAGVRKVRRNMLALQQSLRGISQSHQEGVLQLSNIYWDMYDQNPKVSHFRLLSSTTY
jgi:exocyst complex component 4